MELLQKHLGPTGRVQYKWMYWHDRAGTSPLYDEIKASALENGFKFVDEWASQFDDDRQFTIESRDEGGEALFVLTWSQYIVTEIYDHDKKVKFPADRLTAFLYYTTRYTHRHIGPTLFGLIMSMMIPVILHGIYKKNWLLTITLVQLFGLVILVMLQAYDDRRVAKHEYKLRMRDII